MHNGTFDTLGQVIDHYNAIPADNSNLDPRLRTPTGGLQNLNLTQQQRNDIVAFLATLGGTNVYTDVRWSTPFDTNDQISLIVLNGVQLTRNSDGTETVSCKAAGGMQYQFQYSNNLSSWTTIATIVPDAQGSLSQAVSAANSTFYRFAFAAP
jgi:cytochrome c peroxidase